MKILITNDDGIEADGLWRLAASAREYGEVTVVAPDSQRSAMSHAITLRESIDVYKVDPRLPGVTAYSSTGTPADCVRFGIQNFTNGTPDIVLSGINFGFNCGSDAIYSATVGSALEAAMSGIHAIAVSEGFHTHEVSDKYLTELLGILIHKPLEPGYIWNLNFPDCTLDSFHEILWDRSLASNSFYIDTYPSVPLENGGFRLKVHGERSENAADGTDFHAILHDCISIGRVGNLHS